MPRHFFRVAQRYYLELATLNTSLGARAACMAGSGTRECCREAPLQTPLPSLGTLARSRERIMRCAAGLGYQARGPRH
eukprot:SAG11_NODE_3204_length_2613_cov_2.367940_2_plen_78_part_00